VEFTVTAHAEQRIKLRFGELLDENGEFTHNRRIRHFPGNNVRGVITKHL